MVGEILNVLSVGILGMFLGTQICEGFLFVPYWKSMKPKDFFEFYKAFGRKIHQFYEPLTIVATIIPVLAAMYAVTNNINGFILSLLMGIFTIIFFSTFFIYFKQANKSFAEASISDKELPNELNRWGKWHWFRVGLESIAFIFSLLALIQV